MLGATKAGDANFGGSAFSRDNAVWARAHREAETAARASEIPASVRNCHAPPEDDAGLIDRSARSLQNSNYLLRFCESVLVAWSGEIAAGTELTSSGGVPKPAHGPTPATEYCKSMLWIVAASAVSC